MNTTSAHRQDRPTVLVVGARGALGALVADAFARRGWTVREGGRTPTGSPAFRRVDLTDPRSVAHALGEGVDLVVSAVPDRGLVAERHVLRHGGRLLNLAAGPASGIRALRGDGASGTVVMHAGIAPGVTNLVAAALLDEHPDADEVELVFTVTTAGTGGPASADFAHRGLTGIGRHRVTRVSLPEPFGTRRVLGFAEPDRGWLGPIADGVSVSPYLCPAERPVDRILRMLNAAGLIGRLPRFVLGQGHPAPVDRASREPVAHRVAVLSRGRRLGARLVRGVGDFRMAADSAVVFGDALLGRDGGEEAKPGAWYPEEVLSLDRIDAALSRTGVEVTT